MIEKIYIPTLGRVEEQKTYNDLPDKYKERVIMVVQEHERFKYNYDVEYLIVGDNIGSSKTRELIFKDGCKRKINFLMIDDQMVIRDKVSLKDYRDAAIKVGKYKRDHYDREFFQAMEDILGIKY